MDIHPSAVVAETARLGEGVALAPGVVIGEGADIGDGSMLRANCYVGPHARVGAGCDIGVSVVIQDHCEIGDRCILHPGVVVGADGFGFQWLGDHHHKVSQVGRVVIEDDVEIGANSCIDRATLGETRIGAGTKTDNLVQIGHNNTLGRHVIVVAQSGIGGSSHVGNNVVMSGQVAVSDHIRIGDGAQIGGQSGVNRDVEAGAKVWGTPARPMGSVLREQSVISKLPELNKTVRRQQKELDALRSRLDELEKDR